MHYASGISGTCPKLWGFYSKRSVMERWGFASLQIFVTRKPNDLPSWNFSQPQEN
jgi:hypothetical protein